MKSSLLASALVALLSTTAAAQLEVGADAPTAFAPTEWIHQAPVAIDSLQGRVVAYAFIRLEDDDCLFWLEHWDGLRRRFALDPVTFLAVTNESPSYVRETCETERIDTPFVIDAGDEIPKLFEVQLFPSVFVVSPMGTIAFYGQPGNSQAIGDSIVEALHGASTFPELGKKQKSVSRLLDKWELQKASDAIDNALERAKDDDPDRRRLADIKVIMSELTARLARAAELAIADEDWPRAVTALTRLADEHEGLPGAEAAAARLDELKGDEALAREIAAAIDFAKANRYQRDRNWRAAFKGYESLAKVHPETKAGMAAAAQAVFLEGRAKR